MTAGSGMARIPAAESQQRRVASGMRERHREIKRRRHRADKRKKLRTRLAAATTDGERREIEAKIRKTFPRYTTEV